jgi:Dna[CI] antecedent, DciA
MRPNMTDQLQRLDRFKRASTASTMTPLAGELVGYFDQVVRLRQNKLANVARSFAALVPESLSEHCALYSLKAGTLTVLVDGSVHLYELKQLLLAGLQSQLLLASRSAGVRKIILKPGVAPDPAERISNTSNSSRANRCGRGGTC